jgi:type I protein arginine methyltransferase
VSEDVSKSDIAPDKYLKPVLDDDAVIIGLFDLPDIVPESSSSAQGQDASLVDDLLKRNTQLQEELQRVTAQFERYRATVSETLDQRWGDVEVAEAEAAAAKESGKGKELEGPKKPEDASKYYWESYAGNGTHTFPCPLKFLPQYDQINDRLDRYP